VARKPHLIILWLRTGVCDGGGIHVLMPKQMDIGGVGACTQAGSTSGAQQSKGVQPLCMRPHGIVQALASSKLQERLLQKAATFSYPGDEDGSRKLEKASAGIDDNSRIPNGRSRRIVPRTAARSAWIWCFSQHFSACIQRGDHCSPASSGSCRPPLSQSHRPQGGFPL